MAASQFDRKNGPVASAWLKWKRAPGTVSKKPALPALMRMDEPNCWLWVEAPMANYFDGLGVKPVLGRGFQAGEDTASPPPNAVVISSRLWQRQFAGEASVIGRSVEINKQPATIVGVTPKDFVRTMGGLGFDAWIAPALFEAHNRLIARHHNQRWRWAHAVARTFTIFTGPGFLDARAQRAEQAPPTAAGQKPWPR